MIDFEQAQKIILENTSRTEIEEIPVAQALDRILAQDAAADENIPISDNSAMDGYAVKAEDVTSASEENPVRLEVLETIAAGSVPAREVGAAQASRIMTGAVMPEGADAVIMVEYTERDGETHALIKKPVNGKNNVRFAGEDVKKGKVVLSAGRRLRPADLGMLSATGHASVKVARRPIVGIISTGDEIITADQPLTVGKVRNSNSHSLTGQCLKAGVEPRMLGIVSDRAGETEKALLSAAAECDVVLTTGGVSMGEFDEVKNIIEKLGELIFWKVRMKPGKPLAFGKISDTLVFGLPGNPVSGMVGFEIFVRPTLMKMMGASEIHKPRHRGVLDHDVRQRMGKRVVILRAIAELKDDGYHLSTTGPQGSGILTSMVLANCLCIMPSAPEPPKKGDSMEFFFLD